MKIYTVNNFTGNINQIAEHFDINYDTLYSRLQKGMSLEEAVKTPLIQKHSTIYTVNGFTGNISQIANHFKIDRSTIKGRVQRGMSIEEAVNTPVNSKSKSKIYTVNNFTGDLDQIAEHFDIACSTLWSRLKTGMSIEKAVNTPVDKNKSKSKIYTVNGFTGNLNQIAKHFRINAATLRSRLKNGMSIEETIFIPRQKIATKNIKYNGEVGNLRYFCKKYNKDYVEVFNTLRHMHTLEYALESTSKSYQEE